MIGFPRGVSTLGVKKVRIASASAPERSAPASSNCLRILSSATIFGSTPRGTLSTNRPMPSTFESATTAFATIRS